MSFPASAKRAGLSAGAATRVGGKSGVSMAVDNSRMCPAVATARMRLFFSCASCLIVCSLMALAGCSGAPRRPPTGTPDPDRFLFERGTAELNDKDWFTAREYFRQLVDSYPQSPYRGDAKLGIGDTHLGEGTSEGFVMAINEYREFLSLFRRWRTSTRCATRCGIRRRPSKRSRN
jgi:TolA-binding protein